MALVYLRDVGGISCDGQRDECWVPCAKGDPGAVEFTDAAPDLLEAAKALLPHFERGSFLVETDEAEAAVIALRAAISKATGGAS